MSYPLLSTLVAQATRDLDDYLADPSTAGYEGVDVSEVLHCVADANSPTMTGHILQIMQEDWALACTECESGPAFDGSTTVINVGAAVIYDYILEALWDHKAERGFPTVSIITKDSDATPTFTGLEGELT